MVAIYEISKRLSASGVFIFQNGSRFTAQVGQYFQPNASLTGVDVVPIYSDRNEIRMAPAHRLDLNLIIKSKPLNKDGQPRKSGRSGMWGPTMPTTVPRPTASTLSRTGRIQIPAARTVWDDPFCCLQL